MNTRVFVQDSMGGLPDFDDYELTWGVSVDLSTDTVERLIEN
jgi:hypothetical protein